ncbi:MAG TPA: DUF1615 domain-containing protein [Rhodocyclaceae bacterium]|nr:DUF1615 domain-containing protein [Rhodocyclaceae bacterium]HNP05465.1 DUF1615 domain-containing protein [Rhodocyclaceae bacterium]
MKPSLFWLALPGALLAGCATDVGRPQQRPEEVRALVARLLPAGIAERSAWAADIQVAFSALNLPPDSGRLCAAIAITEQESGFRADPTVPNLSRIAWGEIERRAERIGIPMPAVRLALKIDSPNGKSFAERLDAVTTEKELSLIFEDVVGLLPLGQRLFSGLNPVRTGGPMQVSIAFAEQLAAKSPYPYPVAESIRHEVFSRRGGMYFGIAHLLDYPADYERHLYRFADFNAGRYASRNAAFQNAVSVASGIPLDLDGDLIRHDDERIGTTETALRVLDKRLGMGEGAIRRALEQGTTTDFSRSALYERVFEEAERIERKPLPRAIIPRISLKSPKITRELTTEWFANRVEDRYRRCLERAGR